MRLTYDPRYNIAYIYFQEKQTDMETVRISDELVVDMPPDGTLYEIELLNANEQLQREATPFDDLGLGHRVGRVRPLRMMDRILEYHIYLSLGSFSLKNMLREWPTPWARPDGGGTYGYPAGDHQSA